MRSYLAGLALLVPTLVHAAPIELGGALGGHAFSESAELGVDDHGLEPGADSAAMIGARVGYAFARRLAAEAEAMWIPTQDDVLGDEATVVGIRAHARFDLLTGRIRPFLVAGLGLHVLRSASPQMDDDTDRAYHWGGGIRFAVSPKLDVRVDLRHLLVPDRSFDGSTSDVEVSAGISFKLGGPRPRSVIAVTPSEPGDADRDGILDEVDQCPAQPEDPDGHQDRDGCLDADNDHDGIVDTADTCPLVAETKNGWQDDDGCADQVIAELAGIGFDLDSARIDGASAPILERAFKILEQHPQLLVEISGHTSADGNPDRNLALSLLRAQAVKAYLVKRGIAESRILTLGHGSDVPVADNLLEEGRRKNRRIEFRILRADPAHP